MAFVPSKTKSHCFASLSRLASMHLKSLVKEPSDSVAEAYASGNGSGGKEPSNQAAVAVTVAEIQTTKIRLMRFINAWRLCLTKKAEPPPTRDVNRDSGTASANGGWLRRLVRRMAHIEITFAR